MIRVRTSGGYAKNGITCCYWRHHMAATVGSLVPHGLTAKSFSGTATRLVLAAWKTGFREAASSLCSFQDAKTIELRIRWTMQVWFGLAGSQ